MIFATLDMFIFFLPKSNFKVFSDYYFALTKKSSPVRITKFGNSDIK